MVNTERQAAILRQMKERLGPKLNYLFLEHMRQLSIWAQVEAYQRDYSINNEKPYDEMKKLTAKYPQMMDLMSQYVEACAEAYRNDKAAGTYIDGSGLHFLVWSLKTFGQEM